MSPLEEALTSEYVAQSRKYINLSAEINSLPKGSLQKKNISGKDYYYLAKRNGEKVQTSYVKPSDFGMLNALIRRRKENVRVLKDVRRQLAALEPMIDTRIVNAEKARNFSIDESVLGFGDIVTRLQPIFNSYGIKQAVLFGSYAKGCATFKSDVDLLVKTDLTGLAFFGLVGEVQEMLGKDVDVLTSSQIERGSKIDLEIQKTGVVIYEKQ